MKLTKRQEAVLKSFALYGCDASKWECFGHGANPDIDQILFDLVNAGLLVALPYAEQSDRYGGTRFRVTAQGRTLAGVAMPQQKVVKHRSVRRVG